MIAMNIHGVLRMCPAQGRVFSTTFPSNVAMGFRNPFQFSSKFPNRQGLVVRTCPRRKTGKQKRGTLSGKKTPYFLGLASAPGKALSLSLGVLRTWNGERGIVRADVGRGGGSCLLCWIENLGDYCGVSVVILSPDLDSDTEDNYEEP